LQYDSSFIEMSSGLSARPEMQFRGVENTGVHSGNATLVLRPQELLAYMMQHIRDASCKIVRYQSISSSLVAKGTDVMAVAVPPAFVSKTMGGRGSDEGHGWCRHAH
jgi:hypothetical protein